MRLEEHEAQRVFERLHLRVGREANLSDDGLDAADRAGVVPGRREQLAELAGMLLLQRLAPLEVARAPGRCRRAGHGPAAEVVAPGREQEGLARVGPQALDPLGHERRVQHLLRTGARADRHDVRVVGVARVDRRDRAVEAIVITRRHRAGCYDAAVPFGWITSSIMP